MTDYLYPIEWQGDLITARNNQAQGKAFLYCKNSIYNPSIDYDTWGVLITIKDPVTHQNIVDSPTGMLWYGISRELNNINMITIDMPYGYEIGSKYLIQAQLVNFTLPTDFTWEEYYTTKAGMSNPMQSENSTVLTLLIVDDLNIFCEESAFSYGYAGAAWSVSNSNAQYPYNEVISAEAYFDNQKLSKVEIQIESYNNYQMIYVSFPIPIYDMLTKMEDDEYYGYLGLDLKTKYGDLIYEDLYMHFYMQDVSQNIEYTLEDYIHIASGNSELTVEDVVNMAMQQDSSLTAEDALQMLMDAFNDWLESNSTASFSDTFSLQNNKDLGTVTISATGNVSPCAFYRNNEYLASVHRTENISICDFTFDPTQKYSYIALNGDADSDTESDIYIQYQIIGTLRPKMNYITMADIDATFELDKYNNNYLAISPFDKSITLQRISKDSDPIPFAYNYWVPELVFSLDTKLNNVKINTNDALVKTIGAKRPYAQRFGNNYYNSLTIQSTISMRMHWLNNHTHLWRNKNLDSSVMPADMYNMLLLEQTFIECYDYQNSVLASDTYLDLEDWVTMTPEQESFYENQFLATIQRILMNGKPKLLRIPNQKPMIVYLTDITFSPKIELGRLVSDFSATVTEIADKEKELNTLVINSGLPILEETYGVLPLTDGKASFNTTYILEDWKKMGGMSYDDTSD